MARGGDPLSIAGKYSILAQKIGDLPYSSLQDLVGECFLYHRI
jgi:hypothetical protein